MSDGAEMNKAQRLALAAAEAPLLRNASPKTLARKIGVVHKDGSVTYTSGREVLKGLAAIQDLEHAVEEGVRSKELVCELCGKTTPAGKAGSKRVCLDGCDRRCLVDNCEAKVSVNTARRYAPRRGRCHACTRRSGDATRGKTWASKTLQSGRKPLDGRRHVNIGVCAVATCDRTAKCKGMCSTHYARHHRAKEATA